MCNVTERRFAACQSSVLNLNKMLTVAWRLKHAFGSRTTYRVLILAIQGLVLLCNACSARLFWLARALQSKFFNSASRVVPLRIPYCLQRLAEMNREDARCKPQELEIFVG